jgi:hypothetical protein
MSRDRALRISNGKDRMLFDSKEDKVKLLSKKLIKVGKDDMGML